MKISHKEKRIRPLALVFFLFVMMSAFSQQEVKKHVVRHLDNYYSISLKYDVTIDALKKANPGILSPSPGDTLIIPFVLTDPDEIEVDVDCYRFKPGKARLFRVVLMIPLYLEQTRDSLWAQEIDINRINEVAPFRFIQFYHGFMMAADSLRKSGLDVEIHVFDVDQNMNKVQKALREPVIKKADLIVGPFFRNSFPVVAEFARENRIPIVNPLSTRADILENNPYVFKTLPGVESQPDLIARLVNRDFYDHNIMIYTANKYQGTLFVNRLKEAIENSSHGKYRSVPVIDYSLDSISGFYRHALLQRPNLVIIYAENESLPAALLSKLSALRNEYPITIIGLPEWDKFQNLESIYLVVLKAHLFMSSYLNTDMEPVRRFIQSYRLRYVDEPQQYALLGFDIGFYFMKAQMTYGENFARCLDQLHVTLLQNQFDFKRSASGDGFENESWNILQYDDYRLVDKSLPGR